MSLSKYIQSLELRLLKLLLFITRQLKNFVAMARGGRTAEDDDTWRPSKEDAIAEYDDEILEEELADEEPRVEKHRSSRASPAAAQHKKTSHRPKRQDDDAWKPTDEDLEDEELEVQEMVNHQLMAEDDSVVEKPKKHTTSSKTSKTSTPRKKPVGRPKHQDDDVWKPEGEDVENEEPDDNENSAYEDSMDDEPTMRKRTPPRQAKKRPAASSAGSPELHKTTKPAGLSSPKHRLTTASNKKAPDFIVRGTNDKAPFTFTAYRGEGMVMLAMNWKQSTPPDDFVGFVIEYTEPQSSKCEYLFCILSCSKVFKPVSSCGLSGHFTE